MNDERQDPVWTLLGKARQPEVSPFFASKVLRAVREEKKEKLTFVLWLRQKWYVPVTAGICAAVVAVLVVRQMDRSGSAEPFVASIATVTQDPLQEIAVVAANSVDVSSSLETLLASDDHSIWLAGDPSSLY